MKNPIIFFTFSFLLWGCSSGTDVPGNVKPVDIRFLETYQVEEISTAWQTTCKWVLQNDSILAAHHIPTVDLAAVVVSTYPGCLGVVRPENRTTIDQILALPEIRILFPKDLEFMWSLNPVKLTGEQPFYALYLVKTTKKGEPQLNGKSINEAEVLEDEITGREIINLSMTENGSQIWEQMTRNNINKYIAITIGDKVLSCPMVQTAIKNGETQIAGDFTKEEAEELAMGINAGR